MKIDRAPLLSYAEVQRSEFRFRGGSPGLALGARRAFLDVHFVHWSFHFATENVFPVIKRYNNISLALGVPGIILQIIGNIVLRSDPDPVVGILGLLILFAGTALLIAGLSYYAIGKGRSGWWGLCGFLSFFGLIILALLKDERPDG